VHASTAPAHAVEHNRGHTPTRTARAAAGGGHPPDERRGGGGARARPSTAATRPAMRGGGGHSTPRAVAAVAGHTTPPGESVGVGGRAGVAAVAAAPPVAPGGGDGRRVCGRAVELRGVRARPDPPRTRAPPPPLTRRRRPRPPGGGATTAAEVHLARAAGTGGRRPAGRQRVRGPRAWVGPQPPLVAPFKGASSEAGHRAVALATVDPTGHGAGTAAIGPRGGAPSFSQSGIFCGSDEWRPGAGALERVSDVGGGGQSPRGPVTASTSAPRTSERPPPPRPAPLSVAAPVAAVDGCTCVAPGPSPATRLCAPCEVSGGGHFLQPVACGLQPRGGDRGLRYTTPCLPPFVVYAGPPVSAEACRGHCERCHRQPLWERAGTARGQLTTPCCSCTPPAPIVLPSTLLTVARGAAAVGVGGTGARENGAWQL